MLASSSFSDKISRENRWTSPFSFQAAWHQILPTPGLAIRPKDEVIVRQYTDGTVSFTIRNKRIDTNNPIAKQPYIRHTHHIVPTLAA